MIAAFFIRHWITFAVGLGLVLGAFGMGWQVRGWRCDAALLKAEKAADKQRAKMQAQVEASAFDYETDRSQNYADSYARQETVRTIYRDRPMRGDCAVPADARRLLVEAVESANTGAAR
jgi:hypothetical protein